MYFNDERTRDPRWTRLSGTRLAGDGVKNLDQPLIGVQIAVGADVILIEEHTRAAAHALTENALHPKNIAIAIAIAKRGSKRGQPVNLVKARASNTARLAATSDRLWARFSGENTYCLANCPA
jgi:hypothetical protein